jgi:hypothetical protein
VPGVFSRGGAGRGKPNPMGARLAGAVPPVTVPEPVTEPVAEPDDQASPPAEPAAEQAAEQAAELPAGVKATTLRANSTSLAAAAPAGAAGTVFSVQAGFNLPTPDPFARNRQRVGRTFGEVVVGDGVLLLRLRRKRVGLFLPPVEVRAEEIELAAPTESDFMGNNRGVALVRRDGEHLYVWVDEPAGLLSVLSGTGFPVGDDPVPVTRAG